MYLYADGAGDKLLTYVCMHRKKDCMHLVHAAVIMDRKCVDNVLFRNCITSYTTLTNYIATYQTTYLT